MIVVVLGTLLFMSGQKVGIDFTQEAIYSSPFQDLQQVPPGYAISAHSSLGDAAQVAPLDKLSVVLVAIFAVIFLGERLTIRDTVGIALITVGAILVATGRA